MLLPSQDSLELKDSLPEDGATENDQSVFVHSA